MSLVLTSRLVHVMRTIGEAIPIPGLMLILISGVLVQAQGQDSATSRSARITMAPIWQTLQRPQAVQTSVVQHVHPRLVVQASLGCTARKSAG